MAAEPELDARSLPGCRWMENGTAVLTGDALELYSRLDALFARWAEEVGAEEQIVPAFLPAATLARLDWFSSFPHLATFPVALEPSEGNLARFAERNAGSRDEVELAASAPVRDVLNPAACYHVYPQLEGETLAGRRVFTLSSTCFRRETAYAPLERQWSFTMREIVCLGTAGEVSGFVAAARDRITRFCGESALPIEWKPATDPFFRPASNPKHLAQRIDPVKEEMTFQDRLAVGSINRHRGYFGEAFDIRTAEGEAHSACVAFGVERWMVLVLSALGTRREDWADHPMWRS